MNAWQFISGVIIFCIVSVSRVHADHPDDDAGLLRETARQNRATRSSISTWRGVVKVDDQTFEKGKILRHDCSTVTFALDTTKDLLRWNWAHDSSQITADGKQKSGLMWKTENGLRRKDDFWRHRSRATADGSRKVFTTVFPRKSARFGPRTSTFNPMYFLDDHGKCMADRLDHLAGFISSGKPTHWAVRKEDRTISIAYDFSGIRNEYIVDRSRGGVLVAYHAGNGITGSEDWNITHTLLDGVWTPSKVVYTVQSTKSGKMFIREMNWTENSVNIPLSEKEFAMKAIGVQDGDLVTDAIEKASFRFGEAP